MSTHPIREEFAVVVAAMQAGRIDGQQALESLAAIHEREMSALTSRVHNHRPWRPMCNERQVVNLRGACLNDDGTDR